MPTTPRLDAEELTIGQLAARSGLSASALRFYESEGLIAAERSAGDQRRYRRETLRRVAFIRTAQRVGIPLREVRSALDELGRNKTPTRQDWARLSARWRDELDERIAHLEGLRDRLSGCIGCGCLSLASCQLANPEDVLALEGAGARRLTSAGAGVGRAERSESRRADR